MLRVESFTAGPMANNVYLLVDEESARAAIVDPAIGSEKILKQVESQHLTLEYIFNTHGHFDHVAANAHFKEKTGAKLIIHPGDLDMLQELSNAAKAWGFSAKPSPPPDAYFEDGQTVKLGNTNLRVIHTPGHSPGGVCLYSAGSAIVGDTIFAGSIGRTDFPGGSLDALLQSVREKLFVLPDETAIYPGHGPASTIGLEKQFNPFFTE